MRLLQSPCVGLFGLAFLTSAASATSAMYQKAGSTQLTPLERPALAVASAGEHALAPRVAALANGGYVLVWSVRAEGGFDLFTQRHDATGRAVGEPSRLRTSGTSSVLHSAVAALTGGGHVLAWTQMDQPGPVIQVQRYGADGNPVGTPRRSQTSALGGQVEPEVVALSDGGFVVGWISITRQPPRFGVHARRFDADGAPVGPEITVAATDYFMNHRRVSMAALPDAGFVLAWASLGQDGSGYGVFARPYDGHGEPVAGQQSVNTTWLADQFQPAVTGLADGGFVVTWLQSGLAPSIHAQRFSPRGGRAGLELRVDEPPADAKAAFKAGAAPASLAVAQAPDGGYVISWSALDLAGDALLARRFDLGGRPVGAPVRMRGHASGGQRWPAMALLDNGQLVLAWSADGSASPQAAAWGLYTQRLRVSGRLGSGRPGSARPAHPVNKPAT